jgi:hypothetical protein
MYDYLTLARQIMHEPDPTVVSDIRLVGIIGLVRVERDGDISKDFAAP